MELSIKYGLSGELTVIPPGVSQVTIGRAFESDVCLPESHVSRYHLLLRKFDGRWRGEDQGSLNGTFIRGVRVMIFDLSPGITEVRVGSDVPLYIEVPPS